MTWSLIVLDSETREVGVAGASCTGYVAGIAGIVPGKGAIVAQAMSNMDAKARGLELIEAGVAPREIIARITDPSFDPSFADQQYGVVTFAHFDAPANFTGDGADEYRGALSGPGFSVQGNILTGEAVLRAPFDVILAGRREKRPLYETVMAALEAGGAAGGDKRCGEQRATSAFVTMARPDDSRWNPYVNLVVHGLDRGGPGAVDVLRREFERWKAAYRENRSTQWFLMPPAATR
jgi:uncharacterized Ntn-hydrolase superfamily protein